MKRVAAVLLCLILGTSFAQPQSGLEKVKQRALETFRTLQAIIPGPVITWPKGKKCKMTPQNIYAGKPFLVRSLIHLTKADLVRLRLRVEAAHKEDSDFEGNARAIVKEARLNYQDYYEVPIYHRVCGYMFHVRPSALKDNGLSWEEFQPINERRAQKLLGASELPVFAYISSLSFLRDGYMWISGSHAVNAFEPSKLYRIVDRKGKPVSPSKTRLKPIIFRESFATSMGGSSAYWHFLLPVRLEPLPAKP